VKFIRQDVATEQPLEPTEEGMPEIPPAETPPEEKAEAEKTENPAEETTPMPES
jgi:hypothetical protein